MEQKQQLLPIKDGKNFRELGGYKTISGKKIKQHKLLRSGHLADLASSDLQFLHDYGVKYDVDFRSTAETKRQPDRVPQGAEYIFDPVFSEDLTNSSKSIDNLEVEAEKDGNYGFDHMLFAYEDMIRSDSAKQAYQTLFATLLKNTNDGESVIFHCTAGKDRTGFGSLLTLSALGVPLSTIKADYLLTNTFIKDFVDSMIIKQQQAGASQNLLQSIRDIQSVHAEYFDHAVKVINDDFGSINNYLKEVMGLSNSDLLELRNIYLSD